MLQNSNEHLLSVQDTGGGRGVEGGKYCVTAYTFLGCSYRFRGQILCNSLYFFGCQYGSKNTN